jgi:nicotinamidase-related amidase
MRILHPTLNLLKHSPMTILSVAAQPFDYPFDPAHTALVIIDMQRDFVEPGGFGASLGNDVERLLAIVPTVQRLLEVCRSHAMAVIHTREGHHADLSDCPPAKRLRGAPSLRIGDVGPMGRVLITGEPGNEIVAALAARPGELVIDKPGKGAFYATPLEQVLRARDITHLILCGVTTEVCVQTTMREANDRGYNCLLIEDATESYFAQFKAATLEMVRAQGAIVGWTAPLAALEAALGPVLV